MSFDGAQETCRIECERDGMSAAETPKKAREPIASPKVIRPEFHGLRQSSEYICWVGIKQRCCNPRNPSFARYGGAGIAMCPEWQQSFSAFLAHMGNRPSPKHTVDRIDGRAGYKPGNVRWATMAEQRRNTSKVRLITHAGRTQCLTDWANEYGIAKLTLWSRLQRGMSIAEALASPSRGRGSPNRKLSDAQVLEVRRLSSEGLSCAKIAKLFGMSSSGVWRVTQMGRSL